MLHIWWQCPLISESWKKVGELTKKITGTDAELELAFCLLNISALPVHRYKSSLVRHLLNASKILIPRARKTSYTPSIKDWISEINNFHAMEETMAIAYDRLEYYHKTWNTWVSFRFSDDYKHIMGI